MIRRVIRAIGYEVVALRGTGGEGLVPYDLTPAEREIFFKVRPFTLTPVERVVSLLRAVEHVVRRNVPGALVECGVFQGGSVLAMADMLRHLGVDDRELYLYDTFECRYMEPSAHDSEHARKQFAAQTRGERVVSRSVAELTSLPRVRETVHSSGYPRERFHFVEGKVEDTIPARCPEHIALLRLDTDYYESTKHELVHLFPRLAPGGILIIDDYGCPTWPGSRQATDEFLRENRLPLFLSRIDADARLAIKV